MPGYNTGKIVIGCHYVPPQKNHMNSLDYFWQSILLRTRQTPMQQLRSFFNGDYYGN